MDLRKMKMGDDTDGEGGSGTKMGFDGCYVGFCVNKVHFITGSVKRFLLDPNSLLKVTQ